MIGKKESKGNKVEEGGKGNVAAEAMLEEKAKANQTTQGWKIMEW